MTATTATLASIRIHPIKAFDALDVPAARILPTGALAGDRLFALHDPEGRFVNGKNNEAIHRLRARYTTTNATNAADAATSHTAASVSFSLSPVRGGEGRGEGPAATFDLTNDPAPLCAWLVPHLGTPITLARNDEVGFPDDLESPGPTIVSTASLEAVASWFPSLTLDDVRRRFRTNLEITGVPAFWEDRLFGAPGTIVRFRVGGVTLLGINPCQRCVVPSRDPTTGQPLTGFQKTFAERRRQTLPSWANTARFDHHYRLAVNTRIGPGQAGRILRPGDRVDLA